VDGRDLVSQRDHSFGHRNGFALGVEGLSLFDGTMSATSNYQIEIAFWWL